MVFRIKEKFWSWGNDFSITDSVGNEAYYVKGKVFSWGDELSFQNADRQEVALISQKLLSWKPCYRIIIDGSVFAEVVKEWTWFNKKFTLDVPGPNDYAIEGSFWAHEFTFKRGGNVVANISKKHWAWTDSYGVEIVEGEDEASILCACIVIDQVLHDQSNNASASV